MIEDEDVSVVEITEAYFIIIDSMIKKLEDFDDAVEELKNKYSLFACLEDFDKHVANIEPLQKKFLEEANNQICKNDNYLKKMEQEIELLKVVENNLFGLISEKEQEVSVINSKISNIYRKKENLQGTRDTIQICKLLTNTSFIYKITNVSGYIIGQIPKTINCFELNSEELSKSEITISLYDLLNKVSSEVEKTEDNKKAIYVK